MPTDPEYSPGLIQTCAWCGSRADGPDGFARKPARSLPVSHGMCPACREAFLATLAVWQLSLRVDDPLVDHEG